MSFESLDIHPALKRALEGHGYATPMPVQVAVMAPELQGRDLLVSSQTGSGKTIAFGLALAQTLIRGAEKLGPAGKPLALVVAPTRELALQVQRELAWLYAPAGGRVVACVGGMDPRQERRALAGGAHLVVGTPGRLCDHLERRSLDLSTLKALVLDEADEMLDMGFRDELERLLHAAPKERRTVLFSATLPRPIVELAKKYQRDAERIAATPPAQAHQDIDYRAHLIAPREREHAVVNILRYLDSPSALVFCATRDGVSHLNAALGERGFETVAISGELTQPERTRALKQLRDGRARVLVATDVAARGLDLPDVSLVVQADLPRDGQVLQHRSGRTGRAGRKGVSVLLAPMSKRVLAERMMKQAGVKATWTPLPSTDAIRAKDQEKLLKGIVALAEEVSEEDLELAERLLAEKEPLALAAALVRRERSKLPAAEEMPQTAAIRIGPRSPEEPPRKHPSRPPSGMADTVWFRLNVGRETRADPRWLVPLLCRRGGVSKKEIGKITILPRETRFEVARGTAARFEQNARRRDSQDPNIRIEPLEEQQHVKKAR